MNLNIQSTKDPLLQPYQLKHLTLRNRIMSTSHEPAYSEGGMPKERYRLYHTEKARGGIALTMTAGSAIISADSPAAFGNLHAYKDEIVPWLKELADECHEHGTAVMIQITHLGRRTNWNKADWLPVLAPSPVREPAHRAFPKEAEDWDIARIIRDYATAAQRMQAAGLDGIEIEAYGHLLDGFWSPATNRRDDNYGGSLDNRLRFTWDVLDAIRDATGPDFIVGLRMVADEDWDKGLSREEGVEIAQRLANSGKCDFLNIIRGHIDSDAALSKVIPIQGMAASPHLDFAGEVRATTKFPVFHAARINDVATARHAIAEGKLDMVGMTRAHIADPHIALKVMEGREEEIRPCVGATYCLDRIYEGHEALCIHNAATGREATMPHVIRASEGPGHNIVVVGAGPAGLEAARVAADRGHAVTVFEAAPHPGGQVRLAAQDGRRKELIGIVDWRMARCEAKGVTFRFNTYAEASDVAALNPDIVLVATGGFPNSDVLEEGNDLVVWPDVVVGEPAGAPVRFQLPRQPTGRRLSIADYFLSKEQAAEGQGRHMDGSRADFDTLAITLVTMGEKATGHAAELFAKNEYRDYLHWHGFAVEAAEGLAEMWHARVRQELGIAGNDAPAKRQLFQQGYQGARYAFGYPACPDLEEQVHIDRLLVPSRIGVELGETFQWHPEQTTSALVAHHASARYFVIR